MNRDESDVTLIEKIYKQCGDYVYEQEEKPLASSCTPFCLTLY